MKKDPRERVASCPERSVRTHFLGAIFLLICLSTAIATFGTVFMRVEGWLPWVGRVFWLLTWVHLTSGALAIARPRAGQSLFGHSLLALGNNGLGWALLRNQELSTPEGLAITLSSAAASATGWLLVLIAPRRLVSLANQRS